MGELFRNLNAELETADMRNARDLRRHLDTARTKNHFDGIHVLCHGDADDHGETVLRIGRDVLPLDENLDLFAGLDARYLFLDCCHVGLDIFTLRRLLRATSIGTVWGYTRIVNDAQAYAIEALFYTCLYERSRKWTMREIHARLSVALEYVRIDAGKTAIVDPVLSCDIAEDLQYDIVPARKDGCVAKLAGENDLKPRTET